MIVSPNENEDSEQRGLLDASNVHRCRDCRLVNHGWEQKANIVPQRVSDRVYTLYLLLTLVRHNKSDNKKCLTLVINF